MSEVARLLRTNAFRMAALYLALFAASVLALLAFIYFSMAGFIEQQAEATIRAEMRGLREPQFHHREQAVPSCQNTGVITELLKH